jgi:hypothetical protein
MQTAFQELRETVFEEFALGNVDKFRNYSAQKSLSVDPVTCGVCCHVCMLAAWLWS